MRKVLFLILSVLLFAGLAQSQSRATAIADELLNFSTAKTYFNNALTVYGVGEDAFLTTATIDSFTVAGLTANGIVTVVIKAGTASTLPVAGDLLAVLVGGKGTGAGVGTVGTVYVTRAVGTTSGLGYYWKVEKW